MRETFSFVFWLVLYSGVQLGQVSLLEVQREARILLDLDVPGEDASNEEKAQYKMQSSKVSALIQELEDKGISEARLKPYQDVVNYGLKVSIFQGEERIAKLQSETCQIRCDREGKTMLFNGSVEQASLTHQKCLDGCRTTLLARTEAIAHAQNLLADEKLRLVLSKLREEKVTARVQKSGNNQNKKHPSKTSTP